MRKSISFVSLSIAGILLFGWMLATPLCKSNLHGRNPVVADGSQGTPPPPYRA